MRSIRNILLLLSIGLAGLVISCNFSSGNLSNDEPNLGFNSVHNWIGDTKNIAYNGNESQYDLSANVQTLNIVTQEPVEIFMAKMNVGNRVIPQLNTRYIVSAYQKSVDNARGVDSFSQPLVSEVTREDEILSLPEPTIIRKDFIPARDFISPTLKDLTEKTSSRFITASKYTQPRRAVGIKQWTVGETKQLWTDIPKSLQGTIHASKYVDWQEYTKRTATLKHVGLHCYVWVINDGRVSDVSSKIPELGSKFDMMYEAIRKVFGTESERMYHNSGGQISLVDISSVSDTGSKVNIVVYDIEGDYKSTQRSGVLGYFWGKDYYTKAVANGTSWTGDDSLQLTNEGKYFYIDSGFLKHNPGKVYSTLAHEFQHMIHFGQKNINNRVSSNTWFDEMMSLVCEDMVQVYLSIQDEDAPFTWLRYFNEGYYRSGLTDWLNGNAVAYSYAGAYTFGAYLARNYGGADLFRQIATSKYVNQEAITKALKATGSSETFETVFKKYAQALLLDKKLVTDAPSFNKEAQGIEAKIKAIDSTKYGRPILFKTDSASRQDLRPYGFTFHSVGSTNSAATIQLRFSSPVEQNEKIYILIQPKS